MLLRVGCGLNKYLMWAFMSIVVQFARRTTPIVPPEQRVAVPEWLWPTAAALAISGAFALFVIRSAQSRAAAAEAPAAAGNGMEQAAEEADEKSASPVKGGYMYRMPAGA